MNAARLFRIRPLRAALLATVVAVCGPPVRAALFTVTNENDSGAGSLREAVALANALAGEDEIRFAPGVLTIAVTGSQLDITDDLRIFNTGASQVTIDAAGIDPSARAIRIVPTGFALTQVAMHGLSFINAPGGAIDVSFSSSLAMSGMFFKDNTAGSGGAINSRQSSLTIVNSTFAENRASVAGGAISTDAESGNILSISDSSFALNQASGGIAELGGAIFHNAQGQMPIFHGNTLCENSAGQFGGGLFNGISGAIASMRSNAIFDNAAPGAGKDFRDAGTTGAASGNIVEDPTGHTLTDPPNKLGSSPGICGLGLFGGAIPTIRITPVAPDIVTDKGENPDGAKHDANGGFRENGLAPDVGATESGNRHMLNSGGIGAPVEWLDALPAAAGSPAWINRGVTADAAGATVQATSLGIGWGGGVNASGTVQGAGASLIIDQELGVGIGDTDLSFFTRGVGVLDITGSVQTGALSVGVAAAGRDDRIAEANGNATIGAAGANTLTAPQSAQVGVASAFGLRSSATVEAAKLDFTGASATFSGTLVVGQATAAETANAKVVTAALEMSTSGSFSASTLTVASASSFGGIAEVQAATVDITAAQVTTDFTEIATGGGSAFSAGSPDARIGTVAFTATAGSYAAGNGLQVGEVTNLNFGSGGGTVTMSTVAATFNTGTLTADSLSVGNVASMTGAGGSVQVGTVALTISGSATTIAGAANIAATSLDGGESVTIGSAQLTVTGGSFSTTGATGDFSIGSVSVSGAVNSLDATAAATFTGATGSISGSVSIGNITGTGTLTPGGTASAEMDLVNTRLGIAGDLDIGFQTPASLAPFAELARLRMDPSFTGIGGSLLLGDTAELRMDITGLVRSSLAALGDYSAIDAANVTLDGAFVAEFAFPGLQQGHVFEMIRLDAGGAFTGNFDSITATGLPAGLGVEAQFAGQSFNLVVVPEPSSAALAALAAAMLGARRRQPGRRGHW